MPGAAVLRAEKLTLIKCPTDFILPTWAGTLVMCQES